MKTIRDLNRPPQIEGRVESIIVRGSPRERATTVARTVALAGIGLIADILNDQMGCFLFQLPPSYRYTKTRLVGIVSQLDPARRNVMEFRHKSWWNEEVYAAFRKAGVIFCSTSGPRLPDELIRTADEIYVRLHGPKRWYRHDYSKQELAEWADKIRTSGARRAWIYFNNDNDANAPKNAIALRRMLKGFGAQGDKA